MEPIKLEWKTGKKSESIRISFPDSSITDVNADAVITVLTRSGDRAGGLSESIINRAGNKVMDEIGNEKKRKLTENVVTKAGNLKCKFIIHCVCPKWADYDDGSKSECLKALCNTVKMALSAACDKRLSSVALPPIGSGYVYGIPNFACSAMYVKAMKEFLDFLPGLAHPLKEIIFCDKSREMARLVHNAFEISKNNPKILSEKSVMMQSMNISKPYNHSLHGDSASKYPVVKPGVQSYGNPYSSHPLPPAPQPSSPSTSSNGSIPNSNIPSYWVYKGGRDGTDTFMVNNLKVLIYTYDIVNLCNVDIIVSTENTQVAGNGKLAKAIFQKAGNEYRQEHAKLFSSKKKHNWTDVLQTGAGKLNCKIVLHAIVEQFPNVDPSNYHLNMMWDTIHKVLEIANEKKRAHIFKKFHYLSIALPLLGTGSVTNRNFREKYATIMMQGIEAFSSRSKLRLQEVHVVSVNSDSTQMLVDICRSFCYVPFSGKEERKKPPKEETKKGQRKKPVKLNPLAFNLIETWRALKQNKQATIDSFFESVTTVAPVSVQDENSASEGGNLLLIDSESEDESSQQHSVTPEQMGGACAAIRNGSTCVICLDDDLTEPVRLNICKHEFCRECISEFLSQKPACPVCNTVYGEMFGNQPVDGTAKIYHDDAALPSFKCGTLIIHYEFPDGRQSEEHPSPNKSYRGISRQCYLPDNAEGREILQLLKRAFEHRLIFTVGSSRTSGRDNVVTWNDIHHKTRRTGGPEQYGYPDSGYLARVRDELSAKGISND